MVWGCMIQGYIVLWFGLAAISEMRNFSRLARGFGTRVGQAGCYCSLEIYVHAIPGRHQESRDSCSTTASCSRVGLVTSRGEVI